MAIALPSRAYLKRCLIYDEETGQLRWRERPAWMFGSLQAWKSWNVRFCGKLAFTSQDNGGYFVGGINGKNYRSHRVIWKLLYGTDPGLIDHINGDPSDNRRCNLRSCTSSTNLRNAKQRRVCRSGVTGVYFQKQSRRWVAQMRVPGFSKSKSFTSLRAASSWRKEMQRKFNFTERHGLDMTRTTREGNGG